MKAKPRPNPESAFFEYYGLRVALCISLAALFNAATVRLPLSNLESLRNIADDTCEQYDLTHNNCHQLRNFFSMARFCLQVAIPFGTHLQLAASVAAFFLQLSNAKHYQILIASAQATAIFLQFGHVVAANNAAVCVEKAIASIPNHINNDNPLKDVFRFTHNAVSKMFLVSLGATALQMLHLLYTLRKVLAIPHRYRT